MNSLLSLCASLYRAGKTSKVEDITTDDKSRQWYRSCGNENWEFYENGYMAVRRASINDFAVAEEERLF